MFNLLYKILEDEMETSQLSESKIVTADPTALGQFGLAMVTLVAASQKLGLTEGTALIIPWAIFLGAIAQLFAAVKDAQKNNVFGTTVFGAYGLFWLSVAMTWMIQNGVLGETMAKNADVHQLGFAFLGYLIFSLGATLVATETNKHLFIIMVLIDFLFLGLTLATLGIMPHTMNMMAAWTELIISMLGFYGAIAHLANSHFGREFLPLGKPMGIFKKQANATTSAKVA